MASKSTSSIILFSLVFGFFANAQQAPPTLESPLKVFEGLSAPFTGPNLIPCPDCDEGHYREDSEGRIDKENPIADERFQPDTLYSWMKPEYAESRLSSLKVPKWEGMWRPLFLTRAPLASYPYGSVSLRIKLKPGVKFKRERNHCKVTTEEAETTVYAYTGLMSEFVICSPKVIESVSFATNEHYDEMIRDYFQHRTDPDAASYYMRFGDSGDKGFFHSGESCPDGMCYREETLLNNLKTTLTYIFKGPSVLIYNPEVPLTQQTPLQHFQTARPIYFNAE